MSQFQAVLPEEMQENPFRLIGKDWMLVTAGTLDSFNTMTASWGGVGVLWNKNVCFVFIRPSRYTYEFIEQQDLLSLSFFSEDYRDALKICGSKSGRDVDKVNLCGLSPMLSASGAVAFEEARLVLSCKKLYACDLSEACCLDPSLLQNYQSGDFHRMYVCEILSVEQK